MAAGSHGGSGGPGLHAAAFDSEARARPGLPPAPGAPGPAFTVMLIDSDALALAITMIMTHDDRPAAIAQADSDHHDRTPVTPSQHLDGDHAMMIHLEGSRYMISYMISRNNDIDYDIICFELSMIS